MISRLKSLLTILAAYITITGLVTFSLFIMEESIQMVMFGTWQAKNNPPLLYKGVLLIEKINLRLKGLNTYGGWINPFAWLSYDLFAQATDYWAQCQLQHILAQSPATLEGRQLGIEFQPVMVERTDNGYIGRAGLVVVHSQTEPRGSMEVTVKGGELYAR